MPSFIESVVNLYDFIFNRGFNIYGDEKDMSKELKGRNGSKVKHLGSFDFANFRDAFLAANAGNKAGKLYGKLGKPPSIPDARDKALDKTIDLMKSSGTSEGDKVRYHDGKATQYYHVGLSEVWDSVPEISTKRGEVLEDRGAEKVDKAPVQPPKK